MDIHHLKIFVSVYENRSFSRASEQLGISQPTISEHIKNLEADLKCKLFDRLSRTIIPTEQAELIYPKAQRIIEGAEELRAAVGNVGARVAGRLRLGASTIPGTYILPAIASELKQKYPEVTFEITIGDSRTISERVLGHELLLGVVGAVMEERRLEHIPVAEDELVLAVPKDMKVKSPLEPEALATLPLIMREEGSGTRKVMEGYLAGQGFGGGHAQGALNVIAILGSTDAVKQAVKAGLGVSVVSRFAIRDELASGAIKEVKLKGMRMTRQFYLIAHRKRALPTPYKQFYDDLKARKGMLAGA